MNPTRPDYRRLFLVALATATVLIVILTIGTVVPKLWPGWREQQVQHALASNGPAFWWPSSWRSEYQERIAQRDMDVLTALINRTLGYSSNDSLLAEVLDVSRTHEVETFLNLVAPASHESPELEPESRLAAIRRAPEFELSDQAGGTVRMSDLRGSVVLVSFIFTTCNGSCPATTSRMSLVQRELKARGLLPDSPIRLLSITLDPTRDTPDVLRRYMQLYGVDASRWAFLTGPASDVDKTIEAWGMWARPAANGQLDHPSRIFLVDAEGQIREIYNLSFMNPEWVADDVRLLLDEAKR